jgi:hypothetical protein
MSAAVSHPVVELYEGGLSVRSAAAAAGCSPSTAHRRIVDAGIESRPRRASRPARRVALSDDAVAEMAALYTAGRGSLHTLGTRFGVSGDTVARRLRDANVPVRSPGRTLAAGSAADSELIRRLHAGGDHVAEIRRKVGCSRAEVLRVLTEAGLTPRTGRRARPLPDGAALAREYAAVGSLRALSSRYRASEPRIRLVLTAAGVSTARCPVLSSELRAKIVALVAQDVSPDEIARQTGAGLAAIRRVLSASRKL